MREAAARRRPLPIPAPTPAPLPVPAVAQEATAADAPVATTTEVQAPAAAPAAPRKAKRKASPWIPPSKPPEYHDAIHAVRGRLPDGATFNVTYRAAVGRWTGELLVGDERFEGDAGGLFALLHELDCRFRAARREKPEAASADPAQDGAIC